ncbi:hypothetical protein HK096_002802, partial [Nowakowskiella sp. JEL0078]
MPKNTTKSVKQTSLKSAKDDEWENGVNPIVNTQFFRVVLPAILAITLPIFAFLIFKSNEASNLMTFTALGWQIDSFKSSFELPEPVKVFPLELDLKFTPDSTYKILASSGPKAINVYVDNFRFYDNILPFVYAPMFYAALGLTFVPRIRKKSESLLWIVLIPFLTAAFDVFENYVLNLAAVTFPDKVNSTLIIIAGSVGLIRVILYYFMIGS